MKRRYLYTLLFGIPGLLLSVIFTLIFFATALGVLWLFVFGDNLWPAAVDTLLPLALVVVFLLVWGATLWGGYQVGMRREADAATNLVHVLASASVTVLLLAFMVVVVLFR